MMRLHRPAFLALLSLPLLTSARPARADGAQEKAAAEVLFEDAQRLVAAGQYDAACPKFAESARLARGVGVMLYLADCYEHQGRTASAWIMFRDAEDIANQRGDSKRAALAHGRAATLSPQLAGLLVSVPTDAPIPGLVVKRDGEIVGAAQYGVSIPIDPGKHTIDAAAPGKVAWSSTVDIPPANKTTVTVPALDEVAAPQVVVAPVTAQPSTPVEPPPPPPTSSGGGQRVAGLVIGGVGVAGLAVGGVFGGLALGKLNASNAAGDCAPNNHCSPAGATLRYAAEDRATVSTIGFIAGGALLAGGAVIFLTAPRGAKTVGLTVAPSVAGLSFALRGGFD